MYEKFVVFIKIEHYILYIFTIHLHITCFKLDQINDNIQMSWQSLTSL